MKIIIIPDKFKGSLTTFEVCKAISTGLKKVRSNDDIVEFPMADGGDGFARVLKYYLNTDTINCNTVDPLGREIKASYEWDKSNRIAIIEMAVASGLVLLNENEKNPLLTSTVGTGIFIKDAIEKGANKIILGLGGSATNDAGIGILSALGFQFIDKTGLPLRPTGENLVLINKIVTPVSIPEIKFQIASDVQNVLFGPQGAAYVYAPQKGANNRQVELLDKGLRNFATIVKAQTGKDIATVSGSGAAGGIAAGLMAYFDIQMRKGIEIIIEAGGIEEQLPEADLIITGEGKIDNQSGEGKVVGYIAGLAKRYNIPCIAFCGTTDLNETEIKTLGLKKIIPLKDGSISQEEAIKNAFRLLEERAASMLEFL